MFREFYKKINFLKKIDSFKESDRAYFFYMFSLFVLTSFDFYIKILAVNFLF